MKRICGAALVLLLGVEGCNRAEEQYPTTVRPAFLARLEVDERGEARDITVELMRDFGHASADRECADLLRALVSVSRGGPFSLADATREVDQLDPRLLAEKALECSTAACISAGQECAVNHLLGLANIGLNLLQTRLPSGDAATDSRHSFFIKGGWLYRRALQQLKIEFERTGDDAASSEVDVALADIDRMGRAYRQMDE